MRYLHPGRRADRDHRRTHAPPALTNGFISLGSPFEHFTHSRSQKLGGLFEVRLPVGIRNRSMKELQRGALEKV